MRLTVKHAPSVDLDDTVVIKLLNLYPEERLTGRKLFAEGLSGKTIEFNDFKEECGKLLIPWQLFFLTEKALEADLAHIETLRQKLSGKLLAKRKGKGLITSRRILDRMVRCQNFVVENGAFPINSFCGSLVGLSIQAAGEHVRAHFKIDRRVLESKTKADALAYLIRRFESGNINVCQGVLRNNLLPQTKGMGPIYKSTSGFAIKDERVPFVFIPSELNPDERDGRQIYTLAYLMAIIGLSEYGYSLDKDLKASLLNAKGQEQRIHEIASEFLMPREHTEPLRGKSITVDLRESLSGTHKITPTATVVILRKRGHFPSEEAFKALLPIPQPPGERPFYANPKTQTSVRKFNGKHTCDIVDAGLRSRRVRPVQAQHILFGAVNKKKFKQYHKSL